MCSECIFVFFFFKQKTAYEMRISDWSSDVCSSDLLDMPLESKFGALPKRASGQRPTAFLTVQEGCDKFCTYCVVPYTRGAEISRPFADLIAEARALVAGGVREITLLGQNVNAWDGADDKGRAIGLDGPIREPAREDGVERSRS